MAGKRREIIIDPDQQKCIEFDAGDLLVKGIAGSGKSYVLMERVFKLYNKNREGSGKSILLLTYNSTLVNFMKELFNDYDSRILMSGWVEILTVDSYAAKIALSAFGDGFGGKNTTLISCERGRYVPENGKWKYMPSPYEEIVKECIQKVPGASEIAKDKENPLKFWLDEIKRICERCYEGETDYVYAVRKGRSDLYLSVMSKKIIWKVFREFETALEEKNMMTFEYRQKYLIDHLEKIDDGWRKDYILVDEAQDLSYGQLKFLKAMSLESITLAGDMAQKIYDKSFTWKELGINVTGNSSKTLHNTFRCTKQIMELADDLMMVNRNQSEWNDEYTETRMPNAEGPVPVLHIFRDDTQEKKVIGEYLKKMLDDDPAYVIGILCRNKNVKEKMRRMLQELHIKYQDQDNRNSGGLKLLEGGVKLVTCHSAKGLQFDTVIIPEFTYKTYNGHIKDMSDSEKKRAEVQERSLIYVALTRAFREVILCGRSLEDKGSARVHAVVVASDSEKLPTFQKDMIHLEKKDHTGENG